MHPGIHRTSAAVAALALLAGCGSDDPARDPSDDTRPGEDTAPPEADPPRPAHATFMAMVGWDDDAGAVRDVGLQGNLQPSVAVLELWSQYTDFDAPRAEHLCEVLMIAAYTDSPPPEPSDHRVVLDGAVLGSMTEGCEGWDLASIGADDPSWHASLQWRLALGGPVHPDAQSSPGSDALLLGVTFEIPDVHPETNALIAVGVQVDDDFHARIEDGKYVTMSRDEMLDADVLASGLYMIQSTRPVPLAP